MFSWRNKKKNILVLYNLLIWHYEMQGNCVIHTCVLDGDSLASSNWSSSSSVLGGLYENAPLSSAAFISCTGVLSELA